MTFGFKRHVIPEGCHPLVRELFELMNEEMATMRWVGEQAGVQPATIKQWKIRATPTLLAIEACFGVFGRSLIDRDSTAVNSELRMRIGKRRHDAANKSATRHNSPDPLGDDKRLSTGETRTSKPGT